MKMKPESPFIQSAFRGRVFDKFEISDPATNADILVNIPQMPGNYGRLNWASWRFVTSAAVANRQIYTELSAPGLRSPFVFPFPIASVVASQSWEFNAHIYISTHELAHISNRISGSLAGELLFDTPFTFAVRVIGVDAGDRLSLFSCGVERIPFQ